jgi:hypothetical protein
MLMMSRLPMRRLPYPRPASPRTPASRRSRTEASLKRRKRTTHPSRTRTLEQWLRLKHHCAIWSFTPNHSRVLRADKEESGVVESRGPNGIMLPRFPLLRCEYASYQRLLIRPDR